MEARNSESGPARRPHWSDAYYGALYFDSAADLLTPELSAAEAGLVRRLLRLRPGDRVLDLACGHGRHAWPLAGAGLRVVGLERSGAYLARGARERGGGPTAPAWLRGDVRALPLRGASCDGAFSWYSSLFMFEDETNLACLAEMGRVVRPGGRLLVQHGNPVVLARSPVAEARRTLPDGSVVVEVSRWDPAAGVDRCARRLTRADGSTLEGTAELRYYGRSEWGPLAEAAGLRLLEVTSTPVRGSAPGSGAEGEGPDLIAVLERPAEDPSSVHRRRSDLR